MGATWNGQVADGGQGDQDLCHESQLLDVLECISIHTYAGGICIDDDLLVLAGRGSIRSDEARLNPIVK